MYIVHDSMIQESFEVDEPYKAVKLFMQKYNVSLDNLFVRSYGGNDIPARKIWPRLR